MKPESDNPFFKRIVEASGLSALFAPRAISLACERAGVNPARVSRSDMPTLMPEIARTVRTFLSGSDADAALSRLQSI